ncbi:hypothetical protein [Catenuloplanes indicus]|uniref:Uncharacterized protein n=1 Tax=Catenuloplanes indicus TaxID=137267 RepID=A0AAE3VTK2_9ACTN|nr:hypothetical protein [Catenuloplanes indicus]MDQ0363414.1 hypothetical protein [Catenuloplanes indicus]
MFDLHLANIAAGHRRLQASADTAHEAAHWDAEAARFEQLAEIAQTDPAAARAAYRPTNAYDPTSAQEATA